MDLATLLTSSILSFAHAATSPPPTASDLITALSLTPNPETGYYCETFRDTVQTSACSQANRSASTAIYYLLEGRVGWSYWHRLDAAEVWHFYAGAPLVLSLSWENCTSAVRKVLGMDLWAGQEPQVVVEAGRWQRARSLGKWTLVGTTVAPGFVESGFEMPEPGSWGPVSGEAAEEVD